MMDTKTYGYTNKLIGESSPYLLQHAHNPVEWFPWGEEALEKALQEDKPILVSIGYAACHWCHVMAHESFEDPEVAARMNQWFVNIKIDREERPDLDAVYMDAVQAMNGNGGWPLNVFLTPGRKPFYGGTYFPPRAVYNRMSWTTLLTTIHDAWLNRKDTVETQAANMMEHLHTANAIGNPRSNAGLISTEHLALTEKELLTVADKEWGGFSRAPKFPQAFAIQFLLRQYHFDKSENALSQALLSLDKMLQGGIYDQVGGGFSRYSTDKEWQVPHFEKMLYDNALLLSTYADAYLVAGKEDYKKTIVETIAFLQREMQHPDGGYYSALDADSEGVEGKYYTWAKEEIDKALGKDSDIFCAVYDVWQNGNWEHTNILWLPQSLEKRALQLEIPLNELRDKLQSCRQKLLSARNKRIRPMTDDKIILSWNALLVKALCDAGAALGNEEYIAMAEKTMRFLQTKMYNPPTGHWWHSWKNEQAKIPAFLDDYATLVQAYIRLQEVTGKISYLEQARKLTEYALQHFSSLSTLFFYTPKEQTDIILRKKEIYDSATPSGNSVMANNLFYLGTALDKKDWLERAQNMLLSVGGGMVHYPTSFGVWTLLLQEMVHGLKEIAIVGDGYAAYLKEINTLLIPNKILMSSRGNEPYPLLQDRQKEGKTLLYLCENYQCEEPSETVEEFKRKI